MTFSELKAQVLDDLNRDDLTAQVTRALSSAIKHYEKEGWWFLEDTTATATVANQAYYNVPSDAVTVLSILITASSSDLRIRKTTFDDIDSLDTGDVVGIPTDWCLWKKMIRLYPVPDATYTLTVNYIKTLGDLTDSSDNEWTNEMKDLIRYRALVELYAVVLRSPEDAQTAKSLEMEEYNRLKRYHTLMVTSSRRRKYDF